MVRPVAFGLQLPVQAQSSAFVRPWERSAGVDEIVAVLGLDDASLPLEADVDVAAVGAEYGVSGTADEVIAGLISRRETARSERDFATADAIRDALDHVGIMLEDGPDGTRWLRK